MYIYLYLYTYTYKLVHIHAHIQMKCIYIYIYIYHRTCVNTMYACILMYTSITSCKGAAQFVVLNISHRAPIAKPQPRETKPPLNGMN